MISFLNSLSGKTCMMFCFQAVDLNSELVCIHDSARPLVTPGDVKKVCCQELFSIYLAFRIEWS